MSKKTTGIILIVLGLVVAVLSFLVDLIGIGGDAGYGYIQQGFTAVGVIILIAGLLLLLRKSKPKSES